MTAHSKPAPQKRTTRRYMRWTADSLRVLVQMKRSNIPTRDIAKAIGHPKSSVRAKWAEFRRALVQVKCVANRKEQLDG